ncbi:MAG: hypothetical protein AVDCRST_MAG56-7363 [uncultured Cytophagales bacterium]|uniref:Uncharacterized protein n=1 Tax=uncultured Cytophagales bacterium TaxID=158755 RepID=A0A6J4LDZ1_9SPHI|nr:MAG: hypothetical protein AVDCRST_MAG56-7363 [uncultured Cytophagales bacterium]
MPTPVQTLKSIHKQLNDLSISDAQAQLLGQFFEQSIALLEAFQNPGHDLFELQKRTILKALQGELALYREGYWGKTNRVDRINGFMVARGQLHLLLSQTLVACQFRNDAARRNSFWARLHF